MRLRTLLLAAPLTFLMATAAFSCSAVSTSNHFGNGGSGTGAGTGGDGSGNGSGSGGGTVVGGPDGGLPGGPCTGLQCVAQTDDCAGKGKAPTTISGIVYDPAGALPLYNVYVYIPNSKPDPILTGSPTCTQCEAPASGSPVIGTLTDANGHFTLTQGPTDKWGVPSGANVPLVLQVGKWRRQVTIPSVTACAANAQPDTATGSAKLLRLPAKGSEGDMPLIAFTSGCDPAECFLRHVGIADSEFVAPGNTSGHVHFYTGQDTSGKNGSASMVNGGNSYGTTYNWWSSAANLLKYDIVFNACECNDNDRGQQAYPAMDAYLNGGGRVFATHYYYNWFAPPTGTTDLQGVVNWALPEGFSSPFNNYYVDSTFPKGKAFADWLQGVGATTTYGEINLADTRWDMNGTNTESTRWIYNANGVTPATSANYATMYMSFNTPVAKPATMQCGRAVFSDVHLSGTSNDSNFPNECANADPDGSHAINEKALEFLFFDLSSCVQDNSTAPPPPPPT